MTPKQYMATLRRCSSCPADVQSQVDAWPYPQAAGSHLAIWRGSWPADPGMMPARRLRLRVVNSDIPGALLRMAPGVPRPSAILADMNRVVT